MKEKDKTKHSERPIANSVDVIKDEVIQKFHKKKGYI
jgi:hypothetical protein